MKIIEDLIKAEMTPKTVTHWGKEYHNHTPELVSSVHGDGKCLIYIMPLNTRPNYYILRVDSSVSQMIEADEDEIRDLIEEFYDILEDEFGRREEEDDDGNEVLEEWPALNVGSGSCWGEIN